MILKILFDDRSVMMMIEIDKDKNLIVRVSAAVDNNIVVEYEHVEDMSLFHQQIKKNAKTRQKTNVEMKWKKFIT
jgi:hypothetical protein